MDDFSLTSRQAATLSKLVQGIIPADHRDEGAASVNAGPRLSEKINSGLNAALYLEGLDAADILAGEKFGQPASELTQMEATSLLNELRHSIPGFVKQLRMDVSALYLSDAAVWQRIGFPGPSFEDGGYPDFDQPPI